MARIAIIGFQHETNTYVQRPTELENFEEPDAWPGLVAGSEILSSLSNKNIPAAGFIDHAQNDGHEIVPILWCSAAPGGTVSQKAYRSIEKIILDGLKTSMPIDAVYLDLHGAMVAENAPDAEGRLTTKIRELVGLNTKIIITLDYHANISQVLVNQTDGIEGYRSYPHTDMAATGMRAYRFLDQLLKGTEFKHACYSGLPMLALVWQSTDAEPMKSIMADVSARRVAGVQHLSVFAGFPLAETECAGAAVICYGTDALACDQLARQFAARIRAAAPQDAAIYSPERAVDLANQLATGDRPIILADVQDNPGAGGSSDTVGLLRALLSDNRRKCLIGLICDPLAAASAATSGVNSEITISLGARLAIPFYSKEEAVVETFSVMSLGNGRFTGTGPFYSGCDMDLGPMTLLRCGNVDIAISSRAQQAADQAMFRHLGADPTLYDIVALKSTVHFRADFESMAQAILIVESPGANPINMDLLRAVS